jgi:hypothetical protein
MAAAIVMSNASAAGSGTAAEAAADGEPLPLD